MTIAWHGHQVALALAQIARRTLSDAVYDQLAAGIVAGDIGVGQTLPAERELCSVLGVNRGAVREGVKRLVQAGLVAVRQGDGARVLDFRKTAALDLLPALLVRGDASIDLDVARSVVEMRNALGPEVAARCAQRSGPATHARLGALLEQMRAAKGDLPALQVHALEFWQALCEGSGNVAYQLAFNSLRSTYEQIRDVLVHVVEDEVSDFEGHRLVAQAVCAGDTDAAREHARALLRLDEGALDDLIDALQRSLGEHRGGGSEVRAQAQALPAKLPAKKEDAARAGTTRRLQRQTPREQDGSR